MDWKAALDRVDAFVAARPEIEAAPTGLHIPREVRDAFYSVLLDARRTLAAAVVPDVGFAMQSISALREVRARLIARLKLADLTLPTALQSFMGDLYGGSSQPFLGAMLSYVQRRIDASELYHQAMLALPQSFSQLALAAYEALVAYGCVLLLEPTAVYAAEPLDDLRASLVPTRTLEMGRQIFSATMRLPEAVFETASGKIAFKSELVSEIDFYNVRPQRRRDFSSGGDTSGVIGRRFSLFYRVGGGDTIPLLAERDKGIMVKPDLVIGTFGAQDLAIESYCQVTLRRIETLGSRQTTVLLALNGADEGLAALAARPGAPSFVAKEGGFDTLELKPFIDALTAPAQVIQNRSTYEQ